MSGFRNIGSLWFVWVLVCGCDHKIRRESLEAHAIAHVMHQAGMHEALFPGGALTNPIQLYYQQSTNGGYGYPYEVHRKFLALKEPVGFSNSIYEKYVFVDPPIADSRLEGDTLILMSVEPFPDEGRHLHRFVMLRSGPKAGDYRINEFAEAWVQQLFRAAGREIPKASTTPPVNIPPQSPGDRSWGIRTQSYFNGIAGDIGIGHGSGWVLMILVPIVLAIAGAGIWLLFILARRRR